MSALAVRDRTLIHGYTRPASLGGPTPRAGLVSLRWFGNATFEIAFEDHVLLLDPDYIRTPRSRPLGFTASDVERADLLLVGHPHTEHIGDVPQVVRQTGARVVVAPLGADFLLRAGVAADRVIATPGRGGGDLLEEEGYTVRVLHAIHLDVDFTPEQREALGAIQAARSRFSAPITADEDAATADLFARGVHTPDVEPFGTLTHLIDIEGFRIVYRDSGGPISEEERAYFAANPGVDLAIVSINGLPHVAQQLEDVFLPLVRLYRPRVLVPSHHEELWTNTGDGLRRVFDDVAIEPIKLRVHDELPGTITASPGLIEPLTIDRVTGDVTLGELRLA